MGLFRHNASKSEAAEPQPETNATSGDDAGAGAEEQPEGGAANENPAEHGPFDAADVRTLGPRIDLGAIWLPVLPGLELRMEVDKRTEKVTGISATLGGSGLQVQAFAAPRTWGIWDEVRDEISASVTAQGGTVDDVPGPFGRELIARIPAQDAGGRQGIRPARFVGVDGPRWFLRGVLTGAAAIDAEAARPLESVFANVVVVRDDSPRPPRDLLTLTLPNTNGTAAEQSAPDGAEPDEPGFDPLTRGPEITEIH